MIRWDDHEPIATPVRDERRTPRSPLSGAAESDLEMRRRLPAVPAVPARHVKDTAGTPMGRPERGTFATGRYTSATRVWTLYLRTRDAWIRATRMGHASDRVLAVDEAEKAEGELYDAICPVLYEGDGR